MRFTRITVKTKQMGGMPCIRGLRIPVATVVGMVADGMAEPETCPPIPTSSTTTSPRRSDTPPKPCAAEDEAHRRGAEDAEKQEAPVLKNTTSRIVLD